MKYNKVLVGTRKGLLVLERVNGKWKIMADHFTGIPVNQVYEDPRDQSWWVALDHGHWGCKLHRSFDKGRNWEELSTPQYADGTMIKEDTPAALRYIWSIAAAGPSIDDGWYFGTEPGGLFHLDHQGRYTLNRPLWDHPSRPDHWFGGGRDYAGIHSVVVDPRNRDHIYVGVSVAGVFESEDGGHSWVPRNQGLKADFLPDPEAEVGHDPHLMVVCEAHPEVMWQQNHCGVFRSTDGGQRWSDISQEHGPARFGFAIAADATRADRAWVAPAVSDEIRMAVNQSLCICRTENGGQTWETLSEGLPQEYCFDIVYRHALIAASDDVLFGTTTGNLFASDDGGDHWQAISNYLPMIYALRFAV